MDNDFLQRLNAAKRRVEDVRDRFIATQQLVGLNVDPEKRKTFVESLNTCLASLKMKDAMDEEQE